MRKYTINVEFLTNKWLILLLNNDKFLEKQEFIVWPMWLRTEKKIKIVRFNDSQVRIRFQANKTTNFISINVNFANDRFIVISNLGNFSFKKCVRLLTCRKRSKRFFATSFLRTDSCKKYYKPAFLNAIQKVNAVKNAKAWNSCVRNRETRNIGIRDGKTSMKICVGAIDWRTTGT